MEIAKDIYNVGVNDYNVKLFESQYPLENGMAYNSYLIIDEKIALLDTVEKDLKDEWLNNIKCILKERKIDYLIIHHMEPDHSSNILSIVNEYKDITIVATSKAFSMMKNFFDNEFLDQRIVIKDNDELNLGKHTLKFFLAPMVHWPEVMMSYEKESKTLFSSDAFGKFGTNDLKEDWEDEARRYYYGIIGKYGKQVQLVFKKLEGLDIATIASLHGPILNENLDKYFNYYKLWSNLEEEEKGAVIVYASIYGHTDEAAYYLFNKLNEKGYKAKTINLVKEDIFKAVSDAFCYSTIIIATVTYNNDILPKMKMFINMLKERNYQNRNVGVIENGSWAPNANNVIKSMLSSSLNINYLEPVVTLNSVLKDNNKNQIDNLVNNIIKEER